MCVSRAKGEGGPLLLGCSNSAIHLAGIALPSIPAGNGPVPLHNCVTDSPTGPFPIVFTARATASSVSLPTPPPSATPADGQRTSLPALIETKAAVHRPAVGRVPRSPAWLHSPLRCRNRTSRRSVHPVCAPCPLSSSPGGL